MYHDRTKHVDVKYDFIQDIIKSKAIAIEKISTNENVADILTKAVEKFNYCLQLLNITCSN